MKSEKAHKKTHEEKVKELAIKLAPLFAGEKLSVCFDALSLLKVGLIRQALDMEVDRDQRPSR